MLMFTRKSRHTLAVAALVAVGALSGCQKPPDAEQFGEIITEIPERLDKPFPLPEIENPEKPDEAAGEVAK
jgi:hypothetical protein